MWLELEPEPQPDASFLCILLPKDQTERIDRPNAKEKKSIQPRYEQYGKGRTN